MDQRWCCIEVNVGCCSGWVVGDTYRVSCGELLFRADDCTASLGGVEGGFASDDGLFLRCSAGDFAANLGDGIPVVHDVLDD